MQWFMVYAIYVSFLKKRKITWKYIGEYQDTDYDDEYKIVPDDEPVIELFV